MKYLKSHNELFGFNQTKNYYYDMSDIFKKIEDDILTLDYLDFGDKNGYQIGYDKEYIIIPFEDGWRISSLNFHSYRPIKEEDIDKLEELIKKYPERIESKKFNL